MNMIDMDKSITLSLQELISSGSLSESTFVFEHEARAYWAEHVPRNNDRVRHLNAAKVSLLLARTFSDRYSTGVTNTEHNVLSPASPPPSCIFVQLNCCLELDVGCSLVSGIDASATEEAEEGFQKFSARAMLGDRVSAVLTEPGNVDQVGPSLSRHNPSSSASSFDEAINEIFTGDEPPQEGENKDDFYPRNNSESKPACTVSVALGDKEHDPDKVRQWIPITDVMQFHYVDRASMHNLYCTLLSVGIVWDSITAPWTDSQLEMSLLPEVRSSVAMQRLGNLIHTVFSQDEWSLPSLYQNSVAPELENAGIISDATLPPHSKIRRHSDKSFFSRLVESDRYPVAICRLLSDIIDLKGADSPFASFDEVIHDLNQMSLYPEIFLHNPDESYSPTSLLIGQGYYGRTEEVKKILGVSTRMEQSANTGCDDGFAETIFISGIAGVGKTQLARRASSFLESLGWIVVQEKVDRCTEHQSRDVICSLFDKLISKLVDMKAGDNSKDIEYSRQAALIISETFDTSSLSAVANFIPSLHTFIDDINKNAAGHEGQLGGPGVSQWQMIILVSKLLRAILRLDRYIMLCLDDVHWCDSVMLKLINATILSVAQHKQEKQRLLFVVTYRHNETDDEHALKRKLLDLQENKSVNVTHIKLPSLSPNDVADMVMTETRLPRRLILDLAQVVHKKTSGHAIYVVEFFNSLLRDSTISYSPQKHRLDWDHAKVCSLTTGDDVASLIISNLTSMESSMRQSLSVLSCFGIKTELSLLRHFQGSSFLPKGGFNIASLVEAGFLELSGTFVSFSHDLIQQHAYENIDKRQKLHLDMGTFLASQTTLDSLPIHIEGCMEQLFICDGNDDQDDESFTSFLSLAGIATTQINKAGPEIITDQNHRIRFALWNLRSANESSGKSNFRAALYYYKNGIIFLGDTPWIDATRQLSIELHEGVAFALTAVANVKDVAKYANAIIENVDFSQSLVAQNLLLRSLEAMGQYADTVARGLVVLRTLDFDIPTAPNPAAVLEAMAKTSSIAARYNFDFINILPQVIHPKQKNILKIFDSIAVAAFRSTSPYLPLMACYTTVYSLQHGIFHCEESASAFAIFGYFKISLEGAFDDGRKWGNLAITIIRNSGGNASVRARMYVFGFLYCWYIPIKESCRRLQETYVIGMRCGDVNSAMYASALSWTFQFFGGEKLTVVKANYEELVRSSIKYSKEVTKQAVCRKINLNELVGITEDNPFSVLEGVFSSEAELLADAKSKNDMTLIEAIRTTQFLSAFWMGDFKNAIESSKILTSMPSSKMPRVAAIHYTFYRGIVAYRLFREGSGEHLMTEGNEVLTKMQSLRQACDWVANKLLLLQAEFFASNCNVNDAKEKYDASIKAAHYHGFVHEQGLAYECKGIYFSSIVEIQEANHCFFQAHKCYMQWGATAKARKVLEDHGLDPNGVKSDGSTIKHGRDWDSGSG